VTHDPNALPPGAIVVRGGRLTVERVIKRCAKMFARNGCHGLSVFAASAPSTTLRELLLVSDIPHSEVHQTTVGRIRAAGFVIRRSGQWPHCTIDLLVEPTSDIARRLINAFDRFQPKPQSGERTPHDHPH
jgi:hypothetical protein